MKEKTKKGLIIAAVAAGGLMFLVPSEMVRGGAAKKPGEIIRDFVTEKGDVIYNITFPDPSPGLGSVFDLSWLKDTGDTLLNDEGVKEKTVIPFTGGGKKKIIPSIFTGISPYHTGVVYKGRQLTQQELQTGVCIAPGAVEAPVAPFIDPYYIGSKK